MRNNPAICALVPFMFKDTIDVLALDPSGAVLAYVVNCNVFCRCNNM